MIVKKSSSIFEIGLTHFNWYGGANIPNVYFICFLSCLIIQRNNLKMVFSIRNPIFSLISQIMDETGWTVLHSSFLFASWFVYAQRPTICRFVIWTERNLLLSRKLCVEEVK